MNTRRAVLFAILAVGVIGAIVYFERVRPRRSEEAAVVVADIMSKEEKASRYSPAKEITTPDGFINTQGITIGEFVGKKVVLVDFWTYTCINCQRTTPYLNAWYEKYRDQGLEIIGVHTPEFEFEKEYANVKAAVEEAGIKYPVVLDNDYSTWNAYENRFWPRKYLIDIDGFIVYDHIGEGAYEETEQKIQEALAERAMVLNTKEKIIADVAEPQDLVGTDFSEERSPETYFGALRNQNFGSGAPGTAGEAVFEVPKEVRPHTLFLSGRWDITPEYAENRSANAKIVFRYRGKNVYLVSSAHAPVSVRVLYDGAPLREGSGRDVENGTMIVDTDRLYEVVADSSYGEHTLEFIIESPGLFAYAFTFG